MWELTSFLSLSHSINKLIGMECNIQGVFLFLHTIPWNHWEARQYEDVK